MTDTENRQLIPRPIITREGKLGFTDENRPDETDQDRKTRAEYIRFKSMDIIMHCNDKSPAVDLIERIVDHDEIGSLILTAVKHPETAGRQLLTIAEHYAEQIAREIWDNLHD